MSDSHFIVNTKMCISVNCIERERAKNQEIKLLELDGFSSSCHFSQYAHCTQLYIFSHCVLTVDIIADVVFVCAVCCIALHCIVVAK